MKKYTVSINFAQTNGLPCNLVDIEFNGDSYAPEEFDTLDAAREYLERENAEIRTEQDNIGRTLCELRYASIEAVEYDDDGDVIDSEFIESNFDELAKIVKEMQASDGE